MTSSDFLKNYETSEGTIRKLFDSKLRLAILDALFERPMRLSDLRREVNATAPNTSSKAKELEEMGVVERAEGDFQLTPYGQAVRKKMQDSFEFYATYEKFKEFWISRDLSGIPDYLFMRLGDLKKSEVVKSTPTDISRVFDLFFEQVKSIKKFFYGVAGFYHKDYVEMALELARGGIKVGVVSTPEICNKIVNTVPKEKIKLFDKYVDSYITNSVTIDMSVADSFFSINFINEQAEIKFLDSDLSSTDPRAIQWGLDLFEYYKKQARPVKLGDYL